MSRDPPTSAPAGEDAGLAYRLHGWGPRRIIVLHGLFGDGRSFAPMLPGFDPELWTLALADIRGYGRSAALKGPYDLVRVAEDALALADRLGWSRFSVLGQSMGGKAASRLALLAPSRVERLLGLAPIWAGPVRFDEVAAARFGRSVDDVEAHAEIVAASTGRRLPAYWSREVARASFAVSRPEAYASYLGDFATEDFAAEAERLDQPTLVIVGRHDAATLTMAREGWARMRNAEIVELEQCGHYPHVEAPLIAAALIAGFFDRTGPMTTRTSRSQP